MKYIKKILIWVFMIVYMFVIFGFVKEEQNEINCKSINIQIVDESQNYFIEEKDIVEILNDKGLQMIGQAINTINRNKLEETISMHPTIKQSQIYFTHKGDLNIDVVQKKPIVRIINEYEESYYIDEEGFLMPLSDKFSAHVLIVNGHINESYHNYYKTNVMSESDSIIKKSKTLKNVYQLSRFITQNEFWNAQIEQIYFNEKNEIEIVPRVGTHIILLGNMENFQKKFKKLKAVYDHGFKEYGWNNYRIINLKYENQVICTRK